MNKLYCIGENIVDCIPFEGGYLKNVGGAPLNVAAAAAKLGIESYFLSCISKDAHGNLIYDSLKALGVNLNLASRSIKKTALAIISKDSKGNNSYAFPIEDSADKNYALSDFGFFKRGDVLHYGSVALCSKITAKTQKEAVLAAKNAGCVLSFDVNLRIKIWKDDEAAMLFAVKEFLPYADLVKLTDEELICITKKSDEKKAIENLRLLTSAELIFVTKGENGTIVYDKKGNSLNVAAIKAEVMDTTGAGDCFDGCLLSYFLLHRPFLTLEGIRDAVRFASAGAGISVEKTGGACSMPSYAQTLERMKACF